MGRAILAVIGGYLAMAILVMVTLSLAWVAMGPELAYEEGTTRVTAAWLAVNIPLSLIAAVVGGWVASAIARRWQPVYVLAGAILVVGLGMAVAHLFVDEPSGKAATEEVGRATEMSTFEAASEAVQPTWYNFVIPFVGVAGVWVGGRLKLGAGPD